ncbi:MAG: hypothetical protein Q8S13_01245 [Dehalococcoidia bacterium]|nr:hypothetical protein [Dehalococcoidia bacterium]
MGVIDLLHLIDRLEEQIGEARRLPIGTGSVIDRRRLLDLVDQLRAAVPAEVREAQEILDRKDETLAQADGEAALRLSRADEEVARRLSESEIVKAAELQAKQIIAEAQAGVERLMEEGQQRAGERAAEGERLAAEQMDEADRYALEMLRKLQQQLDAFMGSVRAGLETLEKKPEPEPFLSPEPAGARAEGPPTHEPPSVDAG